MDSINITNARQNLFQIAEQTVSSSKPIRITSKTGDVILLSASDWDAIEETLYLHSIPGLVKSILEDEGVPIEECVTLEDIGWPPIG